jgi:hypothetical protein
VKKSDAQIREHWHGLDTLPRAGAKISARARGISIPAASTIIVLHVIACVDNTEQWLKELPVLNWRQKSTARS